jgi:hypothetical protein
MAQTARLIVGFSCNGEKGRVWISKPIFTMPMGATDKYH